VVSNSWQSRAGKQRWLPEACRQGATLYKYEMTISRKVERKPTPKIRMMSVQLKAG